jgi:hypothetical protein
MIQVGAQDSLPPSQKTKITSIQLYFEVNGRGRTLEIIKRLEPFKIWRLGTTA